MRANDTVVTAIRVVVDIAEVSSQFVCLYVTVKASGALDTRQVMTSRQGDIIESHSGALGIGIDSSTLESHIIPERTPLGELLRRCVKNEPSVRRLPPRRVTDYYTLPGLSLFST